MPNLWIINQFANTPNMPGHTRQYEMASSLIKKGWKVNIFASDFNLNTRKFSKLKKFDLKKSEHIDNIKWHWLRVIPYKNNNYMRYLNILSFCLILITEFSRYLIIKKEKNNFPDIIMASSPQLPATFISLIFAKLFKKPFIAEIRDLWPQVLIDQGGISPRNPIIKLLTYIEKLIYKHAEINIVLAKGTQRYLKKKGARKVIWLPNGPDLDKFKYKKTLNKIKYFSFKRPFKIIYAGAHGVANDLENVIKAAKLIDSYPIQLILIGDGPNKKDLIKKSKDQLNIIFKDPVSKENMPQVLSEADGILISLKKVPLFKYGVSPNKLYDAYAIGRPVITTVDGVINKEVEENLLGFTAAASNPKDLAKAFIKLFKTPRSERISMGKRARTLAEEIYSRQRINIIFTNTLEDIVKKYN